MSGDDHKITPVKNKLRLSFILPLLGFLVLAGFAAVALYSTISGTRNPAQLPSVLIGKMAPKTPIPLLNDASKSLDLSACEGQPILVNFFASWCAPCRAEAPALALIAEYVPVIGITFKDKPADSRVFLAQFGDPFSAIGVDRDGKLGFAWGVYGVPESYVLAGDGTVLWRHAGPIDRRVLEADLWPLLSSLSVDVPSQ